MLNKTDRIALSIEGMIDKSPNNEFKFYRKEIAKTCGCVPSQINYVIDTRFTIDKGYVVDTKRGIGGYISIRKIPIENEEYLIGYYINLIKDQTGKSVIISFN